MFPSDESLSFDGFEHLDPFPEAATDAVAAAATFSIAPTSPFIGSPPEDVFERPPPVSFPSGPQLEDLVCREELASDPSLFL